METGAIRPYGAITHEPPLRRDDIAGSHIATDLPTAKTMRAPQAAAGSGAADNRRQQDRSSTPAVKTGFERDLDSGSIVYRWTDETTEKVILEIPRSDKIRSRHVYQDAGNATGEAPRNVDRSV